LALRRRALEDIVIVKQGVEPVADALDASLVSAWEGVDGDVVLKANLTLSKYQHLPVDGVVDLDLRGILAVAELFREVIGTVSEGVLGEDVCTGFDEVLHNVGALVLDGKHESGEAILSDHVYLVVLLLN
jgi:hypothetical protein